MHISAIDGYTANCEASTIERSELRIGPHPEVEPHLLEQAFPIVSVGTVTAGAGLAIDSLPVTVSCTGCDSTPSILPYRLVCANCGDWHTTLVSGYELKHYRMELLTGTPDDQSTGTTTERATSGKGNWGSCID
jgi:hydrogenase nickel incorporation protein HypA/HybF